MIKLHQGFCKTAASGTQKRKGLCFVRRSAFCLLLAGCALDLLLPALLVLLVLRAGLSEGAASGCFLLVSLVFLAATLVLREAKPLSRPARRLLLGVNLFNGVLSLGILVVLVLLIVGVAGI